MPLLWSPTAQQFPSVSVSTASVYYGSNLAFSVSTQGFKNGDLIYYSTTGTAGVQTTGTAAVSNYLGDLGTATITVTTTRTTSTTGSFITNFYNGSATGNQILNYSFSTPLLTPDPYFTATTLLISPIGVGTTALTDLSGTTSTIQVVGSPNVRSFIPFTTPGVSSSMLFNGSLDQVIIPANTNNAFGTGDFTIEFWMYTVAFTSPSARVLSQGTHAAGEHLLLIYPNGSFDWCGQVTPILAGSSLTGTFVQNTWQHVAITRIGTSMAFYVNGVSKTTATSSYNFSGVTQVCIGGNTTTAGQYFNGYMSNLRITKGLGVYTGAFTTPSGPLQPTQSAGTNIAAITTQTSLLILQSPQAPNNNSVYDSANTLTQVSYVGTPTQGTFSPFWPYATLFNGTNAYQTFPANSIFNFGTGDFTVECWLYLNAAPSGTPEIFNPGDFHLNFRSGTTIAITNNSTVLSNVSNSIATRTWYHVAAVRASGYMTIYLNGVGNTPAANSNNFNTPAGGQIATQAGGSGPFLNGYISNLRAIKGQALYTTNFSPPSISSLLPATVNTVLLTCQGPTSSDYSTFTNTVTNVGSIAARLISTTTFLTTPYSTSTVGGSIYFTSLDTLIMPTTSTFVLGTGDFTIEAWIYSTAFTSGVIFDGRNGVSGVAVVFYITGGVIKYFVNGTNVITSSASLLANTWYHVALVRSSGNSTIFLNGQQTGSTYADSNNFTLANSNYVGGRDNQGGNSGILYISNFRLVKGWAAYTTTFSPSLAPVTASLTGTSVVLNGSNFAVYDTTGNSNIQTISNSATITSSTVKFGSNSMFFNNGSYLNVISNTSTNFTIGTGDFTAEMWIYPTNVTGSFYLMSIGSEATSRYNIYLVNGALTTNLFGAGVNTLGGSIGTNAWAHIAVARQGSTIRGFINGVLQGTAETNSSAIGNNNIVKVGSDASGAATFQGYMSDVRLTKGIARYTGSFNTATTYSPLV